MSKPVPCRRTGPPIAAAWRERQLLPNRFKAIARLIGRGFLIGVVIDPQRLRDGVAIVHAVEAANRYLAGIGIVWVDPQRAVLYPLLDRRQLLGIWPGLAGG